MATLTYEFSPNDTIYVIDIEHYNSIRRGICLQVIIKLQLDSENTLENITKYLILLEDDEGTLIVDSDKTFISYATAIAALAELFDPPVDVTPTPTPSVSVSITPTPSNTPTPSVTPTPSA